MVPALGIFGSSGVGWNTIRVSLPKRPICPGCSSGLATLALAEAEVLVVVMLGCHGPHGPRGPQERLEMEETECLVVGMVGVVELAEGTEMVMPGDNVRVTVTLITPIAVCICS